LQEAGSLEASIDAARGAFFDSELQRGTEMDGKSLRLLGYALRDIVAGKSPKSSSNAAGEDEFGVLKVSAVKDGVFCSEENKALLDTSDFNPELEVKSGMILVTRCNALLSGIGRACLVGDTRPKLMLSDKTLQLIPNTDLVDPVFLLQGLRRQPYQGFVERSANGTEAKNITQDQLRSAPEPEKTRGRFRGTKIVWALLRAG